MLALLKQYLRPRAPAESAESGPAMRAPTAPSAAAESVLDPVALARLTDLDPTGENHLLARAEGVPDASVAAAGRRPTRRARAVIRPACGSSPTR